MMGTNLDLLAFATRVESDFTVKSADVLTALGHRAHGHYGLWKPSTHRWISLPRVLEIETDAIRQVRNELAHEHPHMTMKVDIVWSGDRNFATAEITWPSNERQGQSSSICRAIMAALLRARAY